MRVKQYDQVSLTRPIRGQHHNTSSLAKASHPVVQPLVVAHAVLKSAEVWLLLLGERRRKSPKDTFPSRSQERPAVPPSLLPRRDPGSEQTQITSR